MKLLSAVPPLPTVFYGNVTFYNNPATAGIRIDAYDDAGVRCGYFTIVNPFYYGVLSCLGDDSDTASDEGAISGETIHFRYLGQNFSAYGTPTWLSGEYHRVNLVFPQVVCGDGFCDNIETCSGCESDCGICNDAGTSTGGSGSGSGGGGSGSGGGSGGGFSTPFTGNIPFGVITDGSTIPTTSCTEDWLCGNWSECSPLEIQERNCSDFNACGTYKSKPVEAKECVYISPLVESCYDNIQNQNETGVDCGGPCSDCIEDKPSPPRPAIIELPKIICKKDLNPFTNNTIWFFIVIIIVGIIRFVIGKKEIEKIREKKKLDDVKKAKLTFAAKRKLILFTSFLFFISLVVYFFYVFFFLCEPNMSALWILIAALVIFPFLIHEIIKFFEYDEQKKLLQMAKLNDTHYKEIANLIKIENDHLVDMEKEIMELIDVMHSKQEFSEVLKEHPALDKLYSEMVGLYKDYKNKEVMFKDEKNVCNDIYELANDDSFKDLIEQIPDAKLIYDKLLLLYQHYEEKQKLYDELTEAEKNVEDEEMNDEGNNSKKNSKLNAEKESEPVEKLKS
jgi:hypothetical protein